MIRLQPSTGCKTRFAGGVVSLWEGENVPQQCAKPSQTKNLLVFEVLKWALVPMTATQIAQHLEVQNTHWWTRPDNRRIAVFHALQRIKAIKHPGGFYTLALPQHTSLLHVFPVKQKPVSGVFAIT